MEFQKGDIIELLKRISIFSSENLEEIKKKEIDPNNELGSTYVGLIVRQYSIANDLKILLENKVQGYLTSEFVLFRCIVDDYIHFTYIVNQADKNELIIKLNADAINKNFSKIVELAKINEEVLGGNYPFYPTNETIEDLKRGVRESKERQQHFLDKEKFTFKSFKSTGNLVRDLDKESEYYHSIVRAYFIWRKYSDFVHYSNFAYEEESLINPEEDDTYTEFSEIVFYAYKNIQNALDFFVEKYNLDIVDSQHLQEIYKDYKR